MTERLSRDLVSVYRRKSVPHPGNYLLRVREAIETYEREGEPERPRSSTGRPGGLVYLYDLPTIIVPDLHARMDFFLHVMFFRPDNGPPVIERLADGSLQVVCVGDGFHAEARAADRWKRAYHEYLGNYERHRAMDAEMRESLGLMEMVMAVKTAIPKTFHFLKGNHENIANENGEGNYSFGKFAYEGDMVTRYVLQFLGREFLETYYRFEKELPVLAVGADFLVTHAEPRTFYPREMVIDYYEYPEVIYGLTWTANDAADEGSVETMLRYYLADRYTPESRIFGGHRPVPGLYHLRAGGKYVQIHNPDKFIVARMNGTGIDVDRDVLEIPYDNSIVTGR